MRTHTGQHQAVGGRRKKLALNASLLLIGLSTIAASSADDPDPTDLSGENSECLEVTVYYWVLDENGEKQYVLGPNRCIVSTPWGEAQRHGYEAGDTLLIDSAAGFEVGVPLPSP